MQKPILKFIFWRTHTKNSAINIVQTKKRRRIYRTFTSFLKTFFTLDVSITIIFLQLQIYVLFVNLFLLVYPLPANSLSPHCFLTLFSLYLSPNSITCFLLWGRLFCLSYRRHLNTYLTIYSIIATITNRIDNKWC